MVTASLRAEHDAGATKMFGEIDADKDGNVTQAEMDAGMKMMKKDHAGMDPTPTTWTRRANRPTAAPLLPRRSGGRHQVKVVPAM